MRLAFSIAATASARSVVASCNTCADAAYVITVTSSSGFRWCNASSAPSAKDFNTGLTLSVRSNSKTTESGSVSWLNELTCCRTLSS